jgi:hypothetical protein
MGSMNTARQTNDEETAGARPAGQLNVRFEPAVEAAAGAEGADARKGADEFLTPGLEEAGYGYGV